MTVCQIVLHFLSMFWSLSYVCGTPGPSQMIDDLKPFWIHSNSFIPVLLSVWVGLLCFLLFGLAIDATDWYQLQAKLVPAASLRFKQFTNKHGLTVQVAGVTWHTWQPHVGIPQSYTVHICTWQLASTSSTHTTCVAAQIGTWDPGNEWAAGGVCCGDAIWIAGLQTGLAHFQLHETWNHL